ncbi:hypothetical protein Ddc_02139 [Ditylenchus destructor]|nr:hypothetical protein Ddc_02139 [Ditylenchus destructor]
MLLEFPVEIQVRIFTKLHYVDLLMLESSCRALRQCVLTNIWGTDCIEMVWDDGFLSTERNYHPGNWQKLDKRMMKVLLEKCGRSIRVFKFPTKHKLLIIDGAGMTPLLCLMSYVKELNLSGIAFDKTSASLLFSSIGKLFGSSLEKLDISKSIRKIDCMTRPVVSRECFHHFLESCQLLEDFRMNNCRNLVGFDLTTFSRFPNGINTLHLANVEIPSAGLRQIADCIGATLVSFSMWIHDKTREGDVKYLLERLKRLEHLNIEEFRDDLGITNRLHFPLNIRSSLRSLQILAAGSNELTRQLFHGPTFTNLESLEYCSGDKNLVAQTSRPLTFYGGVFPKLTKLAINDSKWLDNRALESIAAEWPQLEAVMISYCQRVTTAGMKCFLECCENLNHMEVGYRLAEDGLLEMIHESLNIRDCGINTQRTSRTRTTGSIFYFLRFDEFTDLHHNDEIDAQNEIFKAEDTENTFGVRNFEDDEQLIEDEEIMELFDSQYPIRYRTTFDSQNMHPRVVFSKPNHLFTFTLQRMSHYKGLFPDLIT